MQTADQIIDGLGGTSAVAAGLGLTPSTVSSWREVNFIPRWRQPSILALAMEKGATLSTGDFPTTDQRRSRDTQKRDAA